MNWHNFFQTVTNPNINEDLKDLHLDAERPADYGNEFLKQLES